MRFLNSECTTGSVLGYNTRAMAIYGLCKGVAFGVGDVVRVHNILVAKSSEEKGRRTQVFEGIVIGIRGRENGKSFVVRRIGEAGVGIEQIFPFSSPLLEKVEVVREGKRGVRHAKLYYTRDKSKREIEKIYTRARRHGQAKLEVKKAKPKAKKTIKRVVQKTSEKTKSKGK